MIEVLFCDPLIFKKIICLFIYTCACLYELWVPNACMSLQRPGKCIRPPELEFQVVLNQQVGSGSWSWVLCRALNALETSLWLLQPNDFNQDCMYDHRFGTIHWAQNWRQWLPSLSVADRSVGRVEFHEPLQSMNGYCHSQSFAGPVQAVTATVRSCLQRLCHALKLEFCVHLETLLQCSMSFNMNVLFRGESWPVIYSNHLE